MLTSVILRLQAMDFTTLLEGTLADDARARHVRPARIQNQYRDVLLDGRDHRRRMQHLRAEIGQFRGLREADGLHPMASAQDGRVTGEHAIHVGPDLDLLGGNSRAHNRRGEVRPAAAERGGDTIVRRFLLIAFVAAAFSSFNSSANSAAAYFTQDLY